MNLALDSEPIVVFGGPDDKNPCTFPSYQGRQARCKRNPGNISYWRASAEALPLSDGCADLVFISMVYHHLGSAAAAARECHRVLRDGGYVCIRNGTRESDFPHRHFFALQPLIDTGLPVRAEIAATFKSAGFVRVTHRVVRQPASRGNPQP